MSLSLFNTIVKNYLSRVVFSVTTPIVSENINYLPQTIGIVLYLSEIIGIISTSWKLETIFIVSQLKYVYDYFLLL